MWADLAGADILVRASEFVHLALLNEREFTFIRWVHGKIIPSSNSLTRVS